MSGMKIRNIEQKIYKKMDDWLESIDDKDLKKDLRTGFYVTGGCIASMLLGEKVNDYDVYLKSHDLAKRVASYYLNQYSENNNDTTHIHIETVDHENLAGDMESRLKFYIQSEGISEEDSTETDSFTWSEKESHSPEKKGNYRPVCITDNALTLSDGIQIIIRFTGDIEDIHKNFDFVHATCHYDSETLKVNTPVKALQSLMSKSLYYQGSLYPICSIFRLRKFIKREWNVSAGEMFKIAYQVANDVGDKINDVEVLKDQLCGVDTQYFNDFIIQLEAWQKDNPDRGIDGTYLMETVERIFGD